MRKRSDISHCISLVALKGSIAIGNEPEKHEQYNTLVMSANKNETGIAVTALEDETEFILVRACSRSLDLTDLKQ